MTVPSLALVILDGWGLAEPGPGNAISLAETPVFDRLWDRFPHTQLSAQGRDVVLGSLARREVRRRAAQRTVCCNPSSGGRVPLTP